ncbi:MAG TPA: hypothetical protein VGS97_19315 [Actinocrinis sp.]|uniref:hypothetical protein n=1 Tax=Actinocrinis sp. TaxID=1920516 RepID=UPI002DDD654A|nr:hypothetical protein [Actinocrinis sp.]HEV2346257.1 hypothetical protein [Actinocrinis sp.]
MTRRRSAISRATSASRFPNGSTPTSTFAFWWSSSHGRPVETGEADPDLAAVPAVVR